MTIRSLPRWLSAVAALVPLAACVPNLGAAPKVRAASSLVSTAALPNEGGQWPADGWWYRYGDAQLSRLIAEGLAGSPDVATAAARIARAEAVARSAGAALAPIIGAEASAAEVKQSYNNGFPRVFLPQGWNDTGTLALRGSLDLDLWGANRARRRAALDERDAAIIDGAEARLALTTAIASAYADLARLYAERDGAADALRAVSESAGLVANRVRIGLDTEGQSKQAASEVPAARANLGEIDEQIALTRNQLAALVGAGPDRGLAIVRPPSGALQPLALPAEAGIALVGRRPDIAAARARAEAAAERIKAARAAFYPDVSLTGLIGFQALGLSNLVGGGSKYGNAGPALTLPIFDGGQRGGDYRAARADYDAAVADYDRTLITALREVADAIVSRDAVARLSRDSRAALADSESAFAIARLRYKGGLSTYLDVLSAEQSAIVARRRDIDISARAFAVDIALVRALGGGFTGA